MSRVTDALSRVLAPLTRPFLTDRIGVYNGVAARDRALFDGGDHYPHHKAALCDAVADVVTAGDSVVIVGGGRGVAATWAARQGASVTVYEAAAEMVGVLEETAALNNVSFEVRHGIVGRAHDVYGSADGADRVPPGEIAGDVLVLDCEGAETDILPTDAFDRVIVETHPTQGASTEIVLECLDGGEVVAPDPIDGDVVVA